MLDIVSIRRGDRQENLTKPAIAAAAIEDQINAQQANSDYLDRILREYGRLGFFDARKLFKEDGGLKRIVDLDIDEQTAIMELMW